jgi:hypothetical protein
LVDAELDITGRADEGTGSTTMEEMCSHWLELPAVFSLVPV